MLQNASFLAFVAVDTEENEPLKNWGELFSYSVHSLMQEEFKGEGDVREDPERLGKGQNDFLSIFNSILNEKC